MEELVLCYSTANTLLYTTKRGVVFLPYFSKNRYYSVCWWIMNKVTQLMSGNKFSSLPCLLPEYVALSAWCDCVALNTHTITLTDRQTHTKTYALYLSYSLSLFLYYTSDTHTPSHFLSHPHTHPITLSVTPAHTPNHTVWLTYTVRLPLTPTHTHTCTASRFPYLQLHRRYFDIVMNLTKTKIFRWVLQEPQLCF